MPAKTVKGNAWSAIARANAVFQLEMLLLDWVKGGRKDPAWLASMCARFRIAGVGALLCDGDAREMARLLRCSALVDVACRRMDLSRRPDLRVASRAAPFADALAAGALDEAREIARLAPTSPLRGKEYEEDFWRARVQHLLLLDPAGQAPLRAALGRWSAVPKGAGADLAICGALVEADPAAFRKAMTGLLAERRRRLATRSSLVGNPLEAAAIEGKIFVEGLAYLRLAELRKVETRESYPPMPAAARVKVGAAGKLKGWEDGIPKTFPIWKTL